MTVKRNTFPSRCDFLPVEAEQGDGDGEAGVSDHLDQPGQTFSSQTAQQRTDVLQRPRQEGQGRGTHLLWPQRPPNTALVLRRRTQIKCRRFMFFSS